MKIFLRKQVFSLIVATVIFGTLLVTQNSEAALLYNIKSKTVILDYGGSSRPANESSMLWVDGDWGTPADVSPCFTPPVPSSYLYESYASVTTGYLTYPSTMGMTQGDYNVEVGEDIVFEADFSELPVFTADNAINGKITQGGWHELNAGTLQTWFRDDANIPTFKNLGLKVNHPWDQICCTPRSYCCNASGCPFCSTACHSECDCFFVHADHYLYFKVRKPQIQVSTSSSRLSCDSGVNGVFTCNAKSAGTVTVTASFTNQNAGYVLNHYEPLNGERTIDDVRSMPKINFTWDITISNPAPLPVACGNASGAYTPADVAWRTPACVNGTPNVDPTLTPILTSGETRNWQCTGVVGPPADCSANMGLATPIVTLNADPSTIKNINNDSSVIGVGETKITWNITNTAEACGLLGCSCSLETPLEFMDYVQYLIVGENSRDNLHFAKGSHYAKVRCKNEEGTIGSELTTVTAKCNPYHWTAPCDKACGGGNETEYDMDEDCDITAGASTSCNPQPCPTGTSWKEVRP